MVQTVSAKSTGVKGKGFSREEREFVKTWYPKYGPRILAEKMGRSKSGVCSLIARMKVSGELAQEGCAPRAASDIGTDRYDEADGGQDTMGRLVRLRAILERTLLDAEPGQVARLSAEYRACIDEIDRLKKQDGGDGPDVLDQLAASIVRRAT